MEVTTIMDKFRFAVLAAATACTLIVALVCISGDSIHPVRASFRISDASNYLNDSIGISGRFLVVVVQRSKRDAPEDANERALLLQGIRNESPGRFGRSFYFLRSEFYDPKTASFVLARAVMVDFFLLATVGAAGIVVAMFVRYYRRATVACAARAKASAFDAPEGTSISGLESSGPIGWRLHRLGADRLMVQLLCAGAVFLATSLMLALLVRGGWVSLEYDSWQDLRQRENFAILTSGTVTNIDGNVLFLEDGRKVHFGEMMNMETLKGHIAEAQGAVFIDHGGQLCLWKRVPESIVRTPPEAWLTIPLIRRERSLHYILVAGYIKGIEE